MADDYNQEGKSYICRIASRKLLGNTLTSATWYWKATEGLGAQSIELGKTVLVTNILEQTLDISSYT
jgi:hypothetical protein